MDSIQEVNEVNLKTISEKSSLIDDIKEKEDYLLNIMLQKGAL